MNLIKFGILLNLISISNEAFWLVRSKKDISTPNRNPNTSLYTIYVTNVALTVRKVRFVTNRPRFLCCILKSEISTSTKNVYKGLGFAQ